MTWLSRQRFGAGRRQFNWDDNGISATAGTGASFVETADLPMRNQVLNEESVANLQFNWEGTEISAMAGSVQALR
ncbi:hypothetical protein Scep_016175 [Stephania cephalantha]|uniref:Uncharacterized protein n=1 Tax=Stephania cephalantha TaxID=152367 RepID=A0AAP0IP23_9MAGN